MSKFDECPELVAEYKEPGMAQEVAKRWNAYERLEKENAKLLAENKAANLRIERLESENIRLQNERDALAHELDEALCTNNNLVECEDCKQQVTPNMATSENLSDHFEEGGYVVEKDRIAYWCVKCTNAELARQTLNDLKKDAK